MAQPSTKPCGHKDANGVYDCKELRHREGAVYCWKHEREYQEARKAKKSMGITTSRRAARLPTFEGLKFGEIGEDRKRTAGHDYVPDPELLDLWEKLVKGTLELGMPAANLIFFGPKGSGKTEAAAYLADVVGLNLTKADAASMNDPESWFGTREIVVEDGVSVTQYHPSDFVNALQQPGVLFIDEMNRTTDEHRNIILPITDGTGRVTNPLTGELIIRHPHCFIVMSGNRGLQYTGAYAVDPAFTSRAHVVEFDYLALDDEVKVAVQETGVDEETAQIFSRFALETRTRAQNDEDFPAVSTREVIMASRLAYLGMSRDLAVKFTIFNAASAEGGTQSIRQELATIWAGVRTSANGGDANTVDVAVKICPECSTENEDGTLYCNSCSSFLGNTATTIVKKPITPIIE